MFKAIGWLIKTAIFAALILVLGNMLHWKGKTVSDQVKVGIAHAERTEVAGKLKTWTAGAENEIEERMPNDTIENVKRLPKKLVAKVSRSEEGQPDERLPSSERQKLRALIRELNSPQESR